MASHDFLRLCIVELLSHGVLRGLGTNNGFDVVRVDFLLILQGVGEDRRVPHIDLVVILSHLMMI